MLDAGDATPYTLQAKQCLFECKHRCCRSRSSASCCGLQARWRSELRERELDRMAQLEGEIRRREAARTAEVAALRSMLAAQQQQIMALQAQIHEQGGSAQGEVQGLGSGLQGGCCGVGALLRAMLAAQQEQTTAMQEQELAQTTIELCCCSMWELMLRLRQVYCKLSDLALGCFPAAAERGPARAGLGWQGGK